MREQFTECANRALSLAEKKAKEYGTGYVGSEHLLLGLCWSRQEQPEWCCGKRASIWKSFWI